MIIYGLLSSSYDPENNSTIYTWWYNTSGKIATLGNIEENVIFKGTELELQNFLKDLGNR